MKTWINPHMDWVKQKSDKILAHKGVQLEDYIELITAPCQPLDKIRILLVTHMYHIHICILLKDTFWCSQVDKNAGQCKMVVAFVGSLTFYDTKEKGIARQYDVRSRDPNGSSTEAKEKKSPPRRLTFNSQKAAMSDEEVAKLWKQYSKPSASSMAKLPSACKNEGKPKDKPKPKAKDSSIKIKSGKIDFKQHGIQSTKPKAKTL